MKRTILISIITAAIGAGSLAAEKPGAATGTCSSAMRRASEANKYLFAFFYEKDDEATRSARKSLETSLKNITPTPEMVAVDRTVAGEKETIDKFGLGAAPMPLVLAIAPNGAVTAGMKGAEVNDSRVQDAIASPGMQQCLGALQQRKLVFVCLQNGKTLGNDAAMKGVNEMKADPQLGASTVIVKVDPSDAKESKLMAQLQADPKAKEATTAFLAPPGMLLAKVAGATTKDGFVTALKKASSGCGPGAGAGCCPPPKK